MIDIKEDDVTMSFDDFGKLSTRSIFLDCLESVGVDNWEGYQSAEDLYKRKIEDLK